MSRKEWNGDNAKTLNLNLLTQPFYGTCQMDRGLQIRLGIIYD